MMRLMSRAASVSVAGLIAVGVLAGCGSDDADTSQQPSATEPSAATPTDAPAPTSTAAPGATSADANGTTAAAATETRAEILALEGELLDGQQFDLAATAGNDVLLWFWAPW